MSQLDFENKLFRYIEKEQLIKSGDRITAAVSGGTDSTALLYGLWHLKEQNNISAELICVHINHQLRGADSDRDEKFVIELAGKLNIPVITRKVDVKGHVKNAKISVETAARELRIRALCEIAKEKGCYLIATGHQADDNAETIMHRLLRGTGLRGLCGIRPKNAFGDSITFIRPMLCLTRKQITDYLAEKGWKWQTDATNFDCRYRRNFIRHRLLPEIQKQCSKPVDEMLGELSQAARKFQAIVNRLSEQMYHKIGQRKTDSISLDINKFSQLHPAVKAELIYLALSNQGCPERNVTAEHYERILKLVQDTQGNKKISLPAFFTVRKEKNNLIFEKPVMKEFQRNEFFKPVELPIGSSICCGNLTIETKLFDAKPLKIENFKKGTVNYVEWFDFDKIAPPIVIRKRKTGDKFHPLGMPAEKRIGKFLTGRKIPSNIRDNTLIVSDREKIIWLWPVRISEKAKVAGETKKILQMQIKNE